MEQTVRFMKLIIAQLPKIFPPFTGPEGSLPCSKEPAIVACPEPDESK
jgi:hypothetical protein